MAGGLNPYQYVDVNPVGWVEPLGLKGLPRFDNQAIVNRSPKPEIRRHKKIFIYRETKMEILLN